MATKTATQPIRPATPPTDEQLIAQLATLQSLHDKIFQLRSLLPERLIDPVKAAVEASRSGNEPPTALAAHLKSVAVEGDRDVKDFTERWRSEEMKGVWAAVKGAAFPQGSDVWSVDYRGMVECAEEKGDRRSSKEESEAEDGEEVLQRIKANNPALRAEWETDVAGKRVLSVRVAGQNLVVTKGEDVHEGQWVIAANTQKPSKVTNKEILRCLQERPNKRSIKFLVDMVASYPNLKTRPCDKCNNIFDDNIQLPVIRIQNPKPENDSKQFLAYHQGCQ